MLGGLRAGPRQRRAFGRFGRRRWTRSSCDTSPIKGALGSTSGSSGLIVCGLRAPSQDQSPTRHRLGARIGELAGSSRPPARMLQSALRRFRSLLPDRLSASSVAAAGFVRSRPRRAFRRRLTLPRRFLRRQSPRRRWQPLCRWICGGDRASRARARPGSPGGLAAEVVVPALGESQPTPRMALKGSKAAAQLAKTLRSIALP